MYLMPAIQKLHHINKIFKTFIEGEGSVELMEWIGWQLIFKGQVDYFVNSVYVTGNYDGNG